MKLITQRIIEPGINQEIYDQKRNTVRAVFINEKYETLMAYSFLFDDYTFAGGGLKGEESHEEALIRELKEEFGITKFNIIKPIGAIEELRFGLSGSNRIYLQTSYYYLCEILEIGMPSPNEREQNHGLIPIWINIEEAINKNKIVLKDEKHQKQGLKTVLIRENIMLEHIKKEIQNAKI